MSSPIQPPSLSRSLRLAGAPLTAAAGVQARLLALGWLALACGGDARDGSPAPAAAYGVADLALVQRVDSQDLADGDYRFIPLGDAP